MVQLPSPTDAQVGSPEVHDLEAERLPFLPKSVLAEIFSRLLPTDLVNLAATCSTLRHFLLLPASTSIWTRVHENKKQIAQATPAEPERFVGAHPHLLLLRDSYYDAIDSQDALRQGYPPFRDLASLHGVRKRLHAAKTVEDVLGVAGWLVNAVRAWRIRAQNELVTLLPSGLKHSAKSLPLATCVYRRGNDPRPLFYPDMLMGDPYTIKDPERAGPDKELVYCAQSAALVQHICELSNHNVTKATHAQLDALRVRFCCLKCDPEWALVLNWRQSLEHANAHHDGKSISLAKWPSNTAERAVLNEGSVASWVCLKCPSSRHGLLSRPAMRLHLSESHGISQPVEGRQFARAPGAPVPKPSTVLQLHAEEIVYNVLDDVLDAGPAAWKCLHCSLIFEDPSALGLLEDHLNNTHNVVLRLQWDRAIGRSEVNLPPSDSLQHHSQEGYPGLPLPALGLLNYASPATLPAPAFPVVPMAHTPSNGIPTAPSTMSNPTLSGKAPAAKPIPTISGLNGAPSKPEVSTTYKILLPNGARGTASITSHHQKLYGCAQCTGQARKRVFELIGIVAHLKSKHSTPDPALELDFFMHEGPALSSPHVKLLP